MGSLAALRAKLHAVWPLLDERTRRLMAASEAQALGYGGVSVVHRACGLSRAAIARGMADIDAGQGVGEGRTRRPGAGRKPVTVSDPRLLATLERLIDAQTRGDPDSLRIPVHGEHSFRFNVNTDSADAERRFRSS